MQESQPIHQSPEINIQNPYTNNIEEIKKQRILRRLYKHPKSFEDVKVLTKYAKEIKAKIDQEDFYRLINHRSGN